MAKQRGNNGGSNNNGNNGGNQGGSGGAGGGGNDDDYDDDIYPRILDVINNTVSAAVTSHVSRKLKPLEQKLGALDGIGDKLDQILAGGKPAGGGAGDGKPAGGDGGGAAGGKAAPDPEKVALQKRLDAIEAERKQDRINARNAKRDARLTELVTAAGVDKLRVRGAVAILRDQVKIDEHSGDLSMTVQRKGYTEDVDLDDGVAEFFATDEGKAYLAPQGRQGGGGGGGNANTGKTSARTVVRAGGGGGSGSGTSNAGMKGADQAKAERKAQALEGLQGAVAELMGGGNIEIG